MLQELEVKEVGSVVGEKAFVLHNAKSSDDGGTIVYWCGCGRVSECRSEAKRYPTEAKAREAVRKIVPRPGLWYTHFGVDSVACSEAENLAQVNEDNLCRCNAQTYTVVKGLKYCNYCKKRTDNPKKHERGSIDTSDFVMSQLHGLITKPDVELPVTTKMADCLLEIADMPCEAMKSTLVNIAKSLRGLEDCQAAKTVDVGQIDVMLIGNGSPESDLEWRYIVAGVGTDGHVVYLTNKEKWLFCVDINQAKDYAFNTARVLGRIIGHWVEFKRVDILPVPNDEKLFEQLALSGRPKRRTFEDIKERIAKLVKRLDSDLREQQNRDLWGQVEGLLYSIGYTTREAERWAGDNEVSHEFRPRKQLKWRIDELLVEIKSGQNCETVDWNYCGQVKGLRYALMDTPCEAELFVCQALNGGEL